MVSAKSNLPAFSLSLNTATVSKQWDLRQCIEGCVKYGIPGIAPWREQIARTGLAESVKMIKDSGLHVTSLCRGGFFTSLPGLTDQGDIKETLKAVDEAAELDADCLIIVAGGLEMGSKSLAGARKKIAESLQEALQHSIPAGVPLALEPLHPMYAADRSCINTLKQALDICEELGPGIGVAIDVYHTWWDPEIEMQIKRAGEMGIIYGYHICDWLVPTKDILNDRGMMGDGVIDLAWFDKQLYSAGYRGFCEVEIFSERWWGEGPGKVLQTVVFL